MFPGKCETHILMEISKWNKSSTWFVSRELYGQKVERTKNFLPGVIRKGFVEEVRFKLLLINVTFYKTYDPSIQDNSDRT